MNLDHYIEELKTLVNVDCGTQTLAGVATVAGIMKPSVAARGLAYRTGGFGRPGWAGLFVCNKPQTNSSTSCWSAIWIPCLRPVPWPKRPMSEDDSRLYGPACRI
jgi:glutamate carboxypeptidase